MTTTVSTPSVIDTRTDDFRAVLSNFKLFKDEEGSHWTFAGDTSLTNLDTSMQVTLQQYAPSGLNKRHPLITSKSTTIIFGIFVKSNALFSKTPFMSGPVGLS